jgi:hypothetical protein
MDDSRTEFLRDLGRADRGADLEEQTVRLAEFALSTGPGLVLRERRVPSRERLQEVGVRSSSRSSSSI